MPELRWLSPLGFTLGGCGTVIDPGIGQGIMLRMWQPDPGTFA
jgi:hypothetical protein